MKVKLQKDGCVLEPPETAEKAVPYTPHLGIEEPLMEAFTGKPQFTFWGTYLKSEKASHSSQLTNSLLPCCTERVRVDQRQGVC